MLVLTRKKGESIIIGDDIRIFVVEVKGKQVRLGIEAPSDASVHREEVYRIIQLENQYAAQVAPFDLNQASVIWKGKKEGGKNEN